MRKIYVLNLDSRRLLVVAGILLVLFSVSIYLGMKIGAGNARSQETAHFSNIPADIPIVDHTPRQLAENGFLQPPNETTSQVALEAAPRDPVVQEAERSPTSLLLQEDPFIQAPPKRKTAAKRTATETTVKTTEKKTTKTAVPETFYTIQVAAFIKEQDARNLNSRLLSRGYASRVDRGNKFWFVRVGKENRPERLQTQADRLRRESFDVLIKKQES